MKPFQDPFPVQLEKDLLRRYPALEEQIKTMLSVAEETPWPDWCYLPMSGSYAIASAGAEIAIARRYIANTGLQDLYALSSIIPWRYGRPVYRFDPSLAESLMQTESDADEVPVSVIKRLPFPGIFIETVPGIEGCKGLFAFLEYDFRYQDTLELRMHYAFDDGIVPIYIQWTAERETLNESMLADNIRIARDVGRFDLPKAQDHFEICQSLAPRHLNLILYLCADDPDLRRSSPQPRIRSHKGAPETAAYPDAIEVGAYLGSVLRQESGERRETGSESGAGSPKRPHVRRAHWHLYWTGEGRTVPRVKWVMPTFIHADAATSAVVHPVKP